MPQTDLPVTIVIFGASGDLTERMLIPALFSDFRRERLPESFVIVGYARSQMTDEEFRSRLRNSLRQDAPEKYDEIAWEKFAPHLRYFNADYTTPEDYAQLKTYLQQAEGGQPAGRIYYLATLPILFADIACLLGNAGLAQEENGAFRRIVIEKPFGVDLASAQSLNAALHEAFEEEQIYRIDHFLGKETAQNLLFFRFANTIFEPVWNRNYVDNVQITVEETIDIGRRGSFYDQTGVLRDMFQNHLVQLLTLVAMEPPASFQAEDVRNEKVKLLTAIQPLSVQDTVRAQYQGYRQADGVAPDSQTPTYAALKLYVDNWRWSGVPFYLRSGKALARKASEIIIEFRYPPKQLFAMHAFTPNLLSLCIQPDEGMHIKFEVKVPESMQETRPVDMAFHYSDKFKMNDIPDAYERLLLDIIVGDQSLFPRTDGIEAAWRLFDPIIQGWDSQDAPPLSFYESGSWGPLEIDKLLLRDGRYWRIGCSCGEQEQCKL